jgi:amino acid transporter
MIFGLSWGVFLAYVVGLVTVALSLITAFSARDEDWKVDRIDD